MTSQGKQSTGKSFLLNHIFGTAFDSSGGRCTDGIWMSVRVTSTCVFVLMDFEGLGSTERTDAEVRACAVENPQFIEPPAFVLRRT